MSCRFLIENNNGLADDMLTIVVDCLPVYTEITVVLELENYYCINAPVNLSHEVKWQSKAVLLTNGQGQINLRKTNYKSCQ